MEDQQLTFEAIGTWWVIDFYSNRQSREAVEKEIQSAIEKFDSFYSRFRSDSLVSIIAKRTGTYSFDDDGKEMLSLYKKLYDLTDGLFTPLIGNLLNDAGYDQNYSFSHRTLSNTPTWENEVWVEILIRNK